MELAGYIKTLLYNHEQVIIPGIGALITHYRGAEINTSEHTITPPSKYVTFDRNITTPGQIMIDFVASQKMIGQSEAKNFVDEQVKSFKNRLASGETILLEGIGYFSQENNIIRFDREQEANFLTDSYGLSKVDYNPVEYDLTPKQNPDLTLPPKKRNYTYAIVTISLLLLIGVGIAVYLNYPDIVNKIRKAPDKHIAINPAIQEEDTLTDKIVQDSIASTIENYFDSTTNKKRALAIPTERMSLPEKMHYYLIAGSFKTYEKADVLAKQLKKEGYTPEVIQFEEEKYRISLGEFTDKAKAEAELEKIKAKKGENAVWLLAKKI